MKYRKESVFPSSQHNLSLSPVFQEICHIKEVQIKEVSHPFLTLIIHFAEHSVMSNHVVDLQEERQQQLYTRTILINVSSGEQFRQAADVCFYMILIIYHRCSNLDQDDSSGGLVLFWELRCHVVVWLTHDHPDNQLAKKNQPSPSHECAVRDDRKHL